MFLQSIIISLALRPGQTLILVRQADYWGTGSSTILFLKALLVLL